MHHCYPLSTSDVRAGRRAVASMSIARARPPALTVPLPPSARPRALVGAKTQLRTARLFPRHTKVRGHVVMTGLSVQPASINGYQPVRCVVLYRRSFSAPALLTQFEPNGMPIWLPCREFGNHRVQSPPLALCCTSVLPRAVAACQQTASRRTAGMRPPRTVSADTSSHPARQHLRQPPSCPLTAGALDVANAKLSEQRQHR